MSERVVVTRLFGGLGNQLFQYAAGRRLAQVHGAELKLDVTELGNPDYRQVRHYELAPFNVKQSFATEKSIKRLTRTRSGLLPRLFHRIAGEGKKRPSSYIKESHYHFEPRILNLSDGVYLDGYWQSERYFADITDLIRKELTFKAPPIGHNATLAREIADCQAVSLHVRRGDYVTNEVAHRTHGICDLDYYAEAVAHIACRLDMPVFFVFSDDPTWTRVHLKLTYPMHIVDHNGPARGYEDMRLMSLCRHHIIANSTFSWWGAWLNPSQDKIVIAPQRWFLDSKYDAQDLIPKSWCRI